MSVGEICWLGYPADNLPKGTALIDSLAEINL